MANRIPVVVTGAAGRMGETACAAVEGAEGMELVGRADPALDTKLTDVLEGAEVMVDFTTPDAAPANVLTAVNAGVNAVVGSTGFDLEELRATVEGARGEAKCFVAPNFAIGAVLMMELSRQVAPHMPECEIVELHHETKVDAPSGTAKRTAELIDLLMLREGFARLNPRFDFVAIEGVGGWMVPITTDYFSNDLAMDLHLPVIVVAENRLGCLNHVLLTVRAIETGGLKCVGVVLNNLAKEPDLAMTTNAEILRSCLTLPVLAGFDPGKAEFGIGLRQMIPEIEELQ